MRTLLLWVGWILLAVSVQAQQTAPLKQIQTIPLPNVVGRIDHLSVDLKRERLFVAALGNNTLEILALKAGKSLHTVKGLHEPQGVVYVPETDQFVVANGQGGGVMFFSGESFQRVSSVPSLEDADNVRYEVKAKRLYVGYGGGAIAILDAATGKLLGDVKLAGHPESFQLEASGSRLFVNVPTAGHIAVIDRDSRKVVATWPVTEAKANFPMTLDEAYHRLFIGCRDPARLLVFDTTSGKTVASLPIAGDTDDMFYDAKRQRIYISCGEGFLETFQQTDADHYHALPKIPTVPGARTALFVPQWGRLYLAVRSHNGQSAAIHVYSVSP